MSTPILDRLIASRGPALVTFGGGTFLSRESIVIDLTKDTKEVPSSAYGPLTEVNMGIKATTSFRPVGEFEHLDVLWPYAETIIGKSIFGAADAPLLIQPLDTDQRQVTFHAAAINKMPNLFFGAGEVIPSSDVGFVMVGKNNTAAGAANRLFTFATNTLSGLALDPDALIMQSYQNRWLSGGTFTLTFGANTTSALDWDSTANEVQTALNALASVGGDVVVTGSVDDGWTVTFASADGNVGALTGAVTNMPGGTTVRCDVLTAGSTGVSEVVLVRLFPWANFAAREGTKVNFDLKIAEEQNDALGMYDAFFQSLNVSVMAQPQGVDIETILEAAKLQGSGSVRGTKLATGAHHLDVIGSGVFFRLYGANLKKTGAEYDAMKPRIPELTWQASRTVTGGALDPLFYLGTAAP